MNLITMILIAFAAFFAVAAHYAGKAESDHKACMSDVRARHSDWKQSTANDLCYLTGK